MPTIMKIIISRSVFEGVDVDFEKFIKAKYGKAVQKVLVRRLRDSIAASNLSVLLLPGFPGDWHWLEGDRKHQISANLNGGRKMVFEVDGGLQKFKDSSGGINCKSITTLILVEVVNYHK